MTDEVIELAIYLAFEAGRWLGQVDLEEHYDREQYGSALLESLVARKTAMPEHPESSGRTVTINLRSDTWREGVKKSAREYLEKALCMTKKKGASYEL